MLVIVVDFSVLPRHYAFLEPIVADEPNHLYLNGRVGDLLVHAALGLLILFGRVAINTTILHPVARAQVQSVSIFYNRSTAITYNTAL